MFVNSNQFEQRIVTCKNCEHRRENLGIHTCAECGCIIVMKARLSNSFCPLNKWDKVEILEEQPL